MCLVVSLTAAVWAQTPGHDDPMLKAMRDELEHSRGLQQAGLEKPYYIGYQVEEGEIFAASASLGGIVAQTYNRFSVPRIEVHVGSYQFDNTNYVGSGVNRGSRYDVDRFPFDSNYAVLRRYFWLATDQAYKTAVEAISRKRAALKNVASSEELPDFSHAEPTHLVEMVPNGKDDLGKWLERLRSLSAIFTQFPDVTSSQVEFQAIKNVRYLADWEGMQVRTGNTIIFIRAGAAGRATDGMKLHDGAAIQALDFNGLPGEADLRRELSRVAENVTALSRAPLGESYNGPVLFEGAAAAQLFAQVLGKNLVLHRKPVNEPGYPNVFGTSDLEGRLGSRVLPEWMDVTDDPTRTEWQGRRLFGTYHVDFEGVIPRPLHVIEKGELKTFLLTRQPVGDYKGSNGRARLPGGFGAATAAISNLIVHANQSVPPAELRKKLLEICKTRNQKYGVIVRKMDFPSTAPLDEVRRLLAANAREGGGGTHPVSLPILVYKVFPDGKEELVRGVRFRELNVRSLRDIRAAGNDNTVFDYLENGAPFSVMGAGQYAAETSVIAPSILVDDLEIRKLDEELPKLPVVPPPPLTAIE
jgi:TldD protein